MFIGYNVNLRPIGQLGNFINRAEALKGKSYDCLSGSVY